MESAADIIEFIVGKNQDPQVIEAANKLRNELETLRRLRDEAKNSSMNLKS